MPANPQKSDNDIVLEPEPLSPDLLEWARQTFDAEDCMNQVRQIEQTGGHSLESIIREIEAEELSR